MTGDRATAPAPEIETTLDDYFGGQLRMAQPKRGLRIGSDALLLAAAVPAMTGQRALDLGAGVGPAALALACRVPGLDLLGVEIEPTLVALATGNAARNGLSERVRFLAGDIADPALDLGPEKFDHILTNPPFFALGRHSAAPERVRRLARSAEGAALADWLATAARHCRPGGSLTLIWRVEREAEAVDLMAADFGAVRILPLVARDGAAPKRILIQARRALADPVVIRCTPLVLHDETGRYRPEVDAILRGRAPLALC